MKKILLSLTMIALVIAGVTTATVAYFSDTASILGTTFSSGTMDLKIDQDPRSATYNWVDGFDISSTDYRTYLDTTIGIGYDNFMAQAGLNNLKPGDTRVQIIDIANDGTINGNATIDLNRTSGWSDLAGVLNFRVYYDGDHNGFFVDTGLNGTVDQFNGPYTLGPMIGESVGEMNTTASVKIEWSIPTTAGNSIQGDSVTMNAVFGLVQTP
ncbi:hypothetical protein A2422_02745 [Candidatus Woesebacteria bacterium RIFOXYC1_FULL_31_51]|nr:MAG: hypothetical protein UR17_C0001G0053 [Candidatus Woesebacteria bacterium GW2011_GWF1_31_35]OGM72799.1 MAG: hypothetical protein A2185_04650 [Candidatus Woesebacteria bacterium RIFOXYA1_FULL_31_71]OGM77628.1 MAG: hypothetical protein A2375_03475 [Candidatus Woesebacteria bacterium RIFOXYB1_FULL_31_120]OGM82987.1 MAG: hypothetical protein A2422_02745 [Candidatus Woesebacteria bacterium RIFOXYC1_FULL_31_51]OGM85204.1 MAG: hypothetical protein A2595_02630 [Candidatus Woesebacteria bacterium